jgi:hypothetical protein
MLIFRQHLLFTATESVLRATAAYMCHPPPSLGHTTHSEFEYNKLSLWSGSELTKWQHRDDQTLHGIRQYVLLDSDITPLDFWISYRTNVLFRLQGHDMQLGDLNTRSNV